MLPGGPLPPPGGPPGGGRGGGTDTLAMVLGSRPWVPGTQVKEQGQVDTALHCLCAVEWISDGRTGDAPCDVERGSCRVEQVYTCSVL